MSPLVTNLLIVLFVAYAAILGYEIIALRRIGSSAAQIVVLLILGLILHATTGFPTPAVAFGGPSPLAAILIMLVTSMLGMLAHGVLRSRKFSWGSTLKPLVLSPIVLLPLLGAIERSASSIDTLQVVSLAFLAFQNGYFWREVVGHAKARA